MRGFVLAGGLGTRLAPYTTVLPKPLLPLGTSTILETLIRGLAASGVTDVTISLGYLGHLVRAVIGDGTSLGVQVTYTEEPEPLGHGGGLRLLADLSDDDVVLSVNGDTLTDFDFRLAGAALLERDADAVIVVKERTRRSTSASSSSRIRHPRGIRREADADAPGEHRYQRPAGQCHPQVAA